MTTRAEPSAAPDLVVRRLTPARMDDLARVLSGSWGRGCWCMYPRLTAAMERELPGPGSIAQRRERAMTALARRRRAPGLLAYEGDEVVGWVAVAPRAELARVEASRATPRVDDEDVWVVPCVTVRKRERGRGIALALIRAAVEYAANQGAPAVEAYPRAGGTRTSDDSVYYGTEALFRRAGFRPIGRPADVPRNWVSRRPMRVDCR